MASRRSASCSSPHYQQARQLSIAILARGGAQAAVRGDAAWRRKFMHLAMRRERRIAKVAMARKLAVSLYWMWRKQCDYQTLKFSSHAGQLATAYGVK